MAGRFTIRFCLLLAVVGVASIWLLAHGIADGGSTQEKGIVPPPPANGRSAPVITAISPNTANKTIIQKTNEFVSIDPLTINITSRGSLWLLYCEVDAEVKGTKQNSSPDDVLKHIYVAGFQQFHFQFRSNGATLAEWSRRFGWYGPGQRYSTEGSAFMTVAHLPPGEHKVTLHLSKGAIQDFVMIAAGRVMAIELPSTPEVDALKADLKTSIDATGAEGLRIQNQVKKEREELTKMKDELKKNFAKEVRDELKKELLQDKDFLNQVRKELATSAKPFEKK